MCDSLKMARVHAVLHFAQVIDLQSIGDRTHDSFVRELVSRSAVSPVDASVAKLGVPLARDAR